MNKRGPCSSVFSRRPRFRSSMNKGVKSKIDIGDALRGNPKQGFKVLIELAHIESLAHRFRLKPSPLGSGIDALRARRRRLDTGSCLHRLLGDAIGALPVGVLRGLNLSASLAAQDADEPAPGVRLPAGRFHNSSGSSAFGTACLAFFKTRLKHFPILVCLTGKGWWPYA